MIPLGTVPAGSTIYIPFLTYGKTNGESITCSGLAVTDIEIYKNGSTTQRSSDAGYALLDTDGIDFDNITGLHGFSIDLSDNTDSGFFAVGSWYWVVVSAITVDSQTVTFLAATFRIGPAEGITGHPKVDVGGWLGTAPATPTVNGVPEVDVTHWIGTAAATPTTAGVPEVDVTHWLGTAAATPTVAGVPEVDVTFINGSAATGSGTPDVNVVQISGDTTAADNAEAFFDGTGYAGTNNVIPVVTTVNGLAANVITATSIASDAITDAKVASDVTIASVTGSVGSVVGAVGSVTGAVTLPTIPVDWVTASGLAADAVTEIQSGLATAANLATLAGYVDTEVAAIKAKTDNLPSDPADQSAVEAAITAATSPLATAANLATLATYVDTEVAAILADTNELQTDWANGGRLDLLLDQALAAALLARQILGNKHTVQLNTPSAGLHTITVRNDDDTATVRTIVYNSATGARTVS